MNEYNKCNDACVAPTCVAPNKQNMKNIIGETLERLDNLNEQLSFICETLCGTEKGNPQRLEVKCMNDSLVLLLDKARVANEQAQRIIEVLG